MRTKDNKWQGKLPNGDQEEAKETQKDQKLDKKTIKG